MRQVLGSFSRLRARPSSLVEDSRSLQRSQRARVVGEVPRFPTFVLGQENIQRERKGKGKACMFQHSTRRWGFSFATQFSGSCFYGGKILKVGAVGDRERTERGGLEQHAQLFSFPLAKRLPVNQTLWEERQKTNTPNLPPPTFLCVLQTEFTNTSSG